MAGEWREYRIGDIAEVVGGGTPSTADPSNFDGDIPWLTPKDLSGMHERWVNRGERNLSQKGLASCSARLLPARSVLLTTRAPVGYVALEKNSIATNQGFRSLALKPGFDPEFVYYWLTAHTEELKRHASGSTFGELSGSPLKQIGIRVPPLPEYADIPGFCKSATPDEMRKHGYVLTPGRYVGAEKAEDDDEPFEEKMQRLVAQLRQQQAEAARLDTAIAKNLEELGYGG